MLVATHLTKQYSTSRGLITAVNGVSLKIEAGKTLGLVGESGSGKSTLGRMLLHFTPPTSGMVHFNGENLLSYTAKELKKWRQTAQMIFQDPYASLNPCMTVEDNVIEPLVIHGLEINQDIIIKAFEQVGLNPAHRFKYPQEFSGGQRQRIGIARALILNPRFIVCDEPIAALDVSVQAQIVNLLKEIQSQNGLTYLFISHDLRMVKYIADDVAVMHLGQIVEQGPTQEIFSNPQHPYTQTLLASIPKHPYKQTTHPLHKPSSTQNSDLFFPF
ncbi:ATP-binding cassette domain-containing protein [Rhabdochlamydiaceae symbiont of Dictyostelium giganteum]|uniref:ATP-binding cassette domain-containing protein n=1 Tax=Rhabdochlamydiaceae symbiont of Dictyostelium giganteum TaxID=3342349 RepID=UPI00384AD2E4